MDPGGIGSLLLSHVWTDVDTYGHRLEIYGSGGWVFESPRALREAHAQAGFSPRRGIGESVVGHAVGAILGSHSSSDEDVAGEANPCPGAFA